MAGQSEKADKDERKLMKISALEERTGIPRETIHYYIREGLLPTPMKKGLRLAYYDESYINLIDLIKKLQEERYLPLSVIRNLFVEQKYDVEELEKAFLSDVFGKSTSLRRGGLSRLFGEREAPAVPEDYVADLQKRGLVPETALAEGESDGGEQPASSDLCAKLAQLCLRGEQLGFSKEQMQNITARLRDIVELERTSLTEMLRHKESPKEFVSALKDRQSFMEEFLLYQRARFIGQAVQNFMSRAADTRIQMGNDFVAIPSAAFRERYRIDEQIEQLHQEAEKARDETVYERLAWALFLCDRHDELFALDDRRRTDRFKLAVACANAMRDEVEPAVKWVERAVRRNQNDAFFLTLAAGLYMILAARTEGFIEPTIWISKGLDVLEEANKAECTDPFDCLSRDFVRARILLALPEPFGRSEEGRRDLERILASITGKERANFQPSFRGEIELFEVTINYFLAEAAYLAGEKGRAKKHYKRVLELDPAGNFGQKSFVRLGELE